MKILIVKLDRIGDYILFRNFLKPLREKYKNAEITFIGNESYKKIVEEYDEKYLNKTFFANQEKFWKNMDYREELFKKVNTKYDLILHPTYSRVFEVDKFISRLNSKEKITFKGNAVNQKKSQKESLDEIYNLLIETNKIHEFDKYKDFFEIFLKEDLKEIKLKLEYFKKNPTLKYVVLMCGSTSKFKEYSPKKLTELTNFIAKKYNYNIHVCGIKKDSKIANKIINKSKADIFNSIDCFNLEELIDLIGNAEFVITMDSCGTHIAVATNTPVICLSSGIFYGRFVPYPKRYKRIKVLVPPFYFKNFHGLINLIKVKDIERSIIKQMGEEK